jgi:hypothetical protein
MDATLIVIDSDAELARARALVDRLWDSEDSADIARLQAQARLIAAYEESRWPRRPPSTAELIRHLMDQHGLTRADMVPNPRGAEPGQRGAARQEGAEHGNGAAVARALPRAGRPSDSSTQTSAARNEAGSSLMASSCLSRELLKVGILLTKGALRE